MRKPESRFVERVHRRLHHKVFRQKLAGEGRIGVPDFYYEAPGKHFLWIEYKWDRNRPSAHQRAWLTRAWRNQIPVWLVTGRPDGSVTMETQEDERVFPDVDAFVDHLHKTLGLGGEA